MKSKIEPVIIPQNFRMERPIDSRTAKFAWDPIYADQLTDPNSGMRGRLTGFLIQYFKTSGNLNSLNELKTFKVEGNASSCVINTLPPYSAIKLQIAVLNERYQGDFSLPVIYFLQMNSVIYSELIVNC